MLKPLEDTPDHVWFFLCTTDPQKLIAPLRSRCTEIKLKALSTDELVLVMRRVRRAEHLDVDPALLEEIAFGDFVFRDLQTKEIIGRAKDLKELQHVIMEIPDDVFLYHGSRNRLSKWMFSRGLFSLANLLRKATKDQFSGTDEMKRFIIKAIIDYRELLGHGVIARFDPDSYSKYIWFARIGEGSIGGKARGLAFINKILQKYDLLNKYQGVKILIPRTVVVATDYFDQFIKDNGLQYVINSDISDEELLSEFVSSRLPQALVADLRVYLRHATGPLAVRSSSKLEDSHYQPSAGKPIQFHQLPWQVLLKSKVNVTPIRNLDV
jgi:hypothetical protein